MQDASDFEAATGIKWRSCFTDVPDDGNCLMHAVWLGLTTLLKVRTLFRSWHMLTCATYADGVLTYADVC